ncbi:MAG TPA: hypothetical protein VF137_02115 [Candidatus Dormibacteraeota bacterium]
MIEQANAAIEYSTERDRRDMKLKYARRRRMRLIDKLLNELELLNLAEAQDMPRPLSLAVDEVIAESEEPDRNAGSILEAMDVLYDIQESIMFTQIEDE